MVVKEFCADELHGLERACQTDITRIELCSDLSVGGLQVHQAVLDRALEICHAQGKGVYAMVRNRPGDFFYNEHDLDAMERFAVLAAQHGVDGLVFGPLGRWGALEDGGAEQVSVDTAAILRLKTRLLVEAGRIPELVFHMAFDSLTDPERGLEDILEQGYIRILTHGTTETKIDTDSIKRTVDAAAGRIEIMAGGGVTFENLASVLESTGANSVHGTRIVDLSD